MSIETCRLRTLWVTCVIALWLIAVQAQAGELRFTFIGNEAFHITDGDTTLLSDFPYRPGAFGYMDYSLDAVPAITHGLSLITHTHADHWYKDLFEKMDLFVVGPPGMTKRLPPDRVIPFRLDGPMSFRGLEIQAAETPHKLAIEHYSYLVTWHGIRIYFPGDTENPSEILRQRDIDVMFVTPWLIRTIERQKLHLDTKLLVAYHQRVDEDVPSFQHCRTMQQGESFTIEYRVPEVRQK